MNSSIHLVLRRALILSASAVILIVLGTIAFGQQTAARPDRGVNPGGSYSISDIENINLQNGNVQLSIPLASLPAIAGGRLSFGLSANYNSKLWNITRSEQVGSGLPYQTYVVDTPQLSDVGGWSFGGAYAIFTRDATEDFAYVIPPSPDPYDGYAVADYQLLTQYNWKRMVLRTPDGAEHELRPNGGNYYAYNFSGHPHPYLWSYYRDTPDTTGTPMRYNSSDGTYLSAIVNPYGHASGIQWTIFLPDGTQIISYSNGIQRIRDNNGNSIKIFSDANGMHYQDEQTGREIRSTYDPQGAGGYGQVQVWYPTVGGGSQHIDINYGETIVQGKIYDVEDFNYNVTNEYGQQGIPCKRVQQLLPQTVSVVREIVFPATEPNTQGRRFTFSYNSDTTETATTQAVQWSCGAQFQSYTRTASHGLGALSQMVTPSGAEVDYTYTQAGVHDFIGSNGLLNADYMARETLTAKDLHHDGLIDTWHYNIPNEANSGASSVTNPDGSTVSQSYFPIDPNFAQVVGTGVGARNGLVFSSSNGVIQTLRHWVAGSQMATGSTGVTTVNPLVDAEYTALVGTTLMSARTYQHDCNGNVTQVTDYDWFDSSQVTLDSAGVPTAPPAGATVLRVTNTSYHNSAPNTNSANAYTLRTLAAGTPSILNAVQQTTVGPGITQLSYDGQSYGVAPTVGNLTSQSTWDDLDNKWITSSQTYGLYGNLTTKTDARGKVTQFYYDDATHALPNRVVVDPQNTTGTQTTTTAFDYYTGLVTSTTDANNQTSTIDYTNQLLSSVDPFGRPGVVISPLVNAGGTNQYHRTKTYYADSSRTVTVAADLNSEGDGLLKSQVLSDMLGRTIEGRQYETANTFIAVRQTYDAVHRTHQTSNPFRAGETVIWTTAVADELGRIISVTTPDSALVSTAYSANTVTVTDQTGKQRKSVSDALGRLIQVYEDPNGLNYLTSYNYDVFGNLLHVYQGSQTRTFAYDSLSRLRTAANPESGTLTYTYDDNGNLSTKTDARNVVSNYVYDALNRAVTRSYSDGTPTVTYSYDSGTISNGEGRLASVSSSVSTYSYSGYDAVGKVLGGSQTINGQGGNQTYSLSYVYDLVGHVTSMTYPSGRVVNYNYDNAGRLGDKDVTHLAFTGNLGDGTTRNYSTGITYASAGQMAQEQFGTNTPVYNKLFYNSRQQLSEILASTTGGDASFNRGKIVNDYTDQCSGAPCNGTDNNGNLKKQTLYVPNNQNTSSTSWYQQYGYDSLNRLTQVHEYTGNTSLDWQQQYSYDRYGNRTINNNGSATWGQGINNVSAAIDTNTNRMYATNDPSHSVIDYDVAGNQTKDYLTSNGTRIYDAENRMISATDSYNHTSTYTYDGDGHRVKRSSNGTETWQVYGIGGELLAEYAVNAAPSSPQKEYGYRNGQLLITATAPSALAANTSPVTKPEAVAAASPASGKESATAAQSFDLLASIKGLVLRLPSTSTPANASTEAVSDTSTPLYGPSFPYAVSLNRSAIPLMPQSGSAKIAFASNRDGSAQIYSMNTDGSGLSRLTNDAANDEVPNWSPNNSRIVFQSDRDNLFSGIADIYVMNWDGSGQTRLTSDPADDSAPVWSPDGTKIAFQSARNGVSYQVYMMNADGSGQVNISNSAANDDQPSWSPDGSKIAFASDRDQAGFSSIYVMNANGTNQTRLTISGTGVLDQQPAWSPDGTKLAFTSTRDSTVVTWQEWNLGQLVVKTKLLINKEVYVMNADGSAQVRVTNTPGNDDSPMWSSDGTRIAFRSDRDRTCCDPTEQVWVMNADGSNQVNLSNNQFGDYSPNWSGAMVNTPPAVSITSSANGASFTAPANITVTANASDSDGSVTRVDFYQGVTLIGTATTSPYTVTWNSVAAGSYSLTARATDNFGATSTSAAVTITVNANAPPAVSITSPAAGALFTAPANITVTANASDSDGSVSRVDFYQGATLIGTATTSPYTISWNNVAAGNYALTARATDNLGANTTSASVNITVNAPPVVSITTPTNGASFTAPANITVTANASDSDGSISRVDFYQGTTLIGTATTSPYTIAWNNVVAGGYTLTARATDNLGASTTSNPVNITVGSPPTVSVTTPTSGTSFTATANVTITANASASNGSINRVEFYQGATLVGTTSVSPYTISWNNVAAGGYTLKARAIDNSGASTDSTPVSIVVNAPPTVSITNPTSGASFTAPANITVTANASDTDGTVSRVEFYQGATLIGTATTSPFTINWNNVAAGSYTLTARATDNLGATTSSNPVNLTVNAPPAVNITTPTNGASFTAPVNITITANASDSDGSIGRVDFYQGTTLIGTATTSPYTITWNNVAAGGYTLKARAIDNSGASTDSTPVNISVNAPPAVSITSPTSGASLTSPANITITANASDGDGTISRVDFYQGATLIGTATASPYNVSWNNVTTGTYSVTAKATDNVGAQTNSTAVNITVITTVADVRWIVTDQVGTPRMIFDQTGSLANVSHHDYLPFGEELFAGTGGRTAAQGYSVSDDLRNHFTLKERDNETGLDYSINRYYSPSQGRFTGPDQLFADQNESDPQSWNLYTYVGNSPLMFTDPSGLWKQVECSSGKCWEAEEGDNWSKLAEVTGYSGAGLQRFFVGETISVGQVFDVGGYESWTRSLNNKMLGSVFRNGWEKYNFEPPMGGGLRNVTKEAAATGLLSRVGRLLGFGEKAAPIAEEAAIGGRTISTIGKELKNVRPLGSGRLGGYLRGNTNLPGGNSAAREAFRQLTGRYPVGSLDRAVRGGKEIVYRALGESGHSKIELIDHAQRFLEKITFN